MSALRDRAVRSLMAALAPAGRALCTPALLPRMRHLPALSRLIRTPTRPPLGAWHERPPRAVPPELLSVAGIRKDREAEDRARADAPLRSFNSSYPLAIDAIRRQVWPAMLQVAPSLMRSRRECAEVALRSPTGAPQVIDRGQLARELKAFGAEIGLSAIGITTYDERYAAPRDPSRPDVQCGEYVIVALLEQSFAATDSAPSVRSNKAQFMTYASLGPRLVRLAEFLHARRPSSTSAAACRWSRWRTAARSA